MAINFEPKLIKFIINLGYSFLVISAVCLYKSITAMNDLEHGSEIEYALWLIVARIFGIATFIIAAFSISHKKWTTGTILFIGSLGLPFISLLLHGKI